MMSFETWRSRRDPLHLLSIANLAVHSSDQLALVAIPIIAVTVLESSAATTSWLTAISTIPFLLFAIPAGIIADNGHRSHLMVCGEALRAATLFGMFSLAVSDNVSILALAALGMLGAIGTVIFTVGLPTALPQYVQAKDLGKANSQLEFIRSIAITAGPAMGGAFLGLASATTFFAVATLVATFGTLTLVKLPDSRRERTERKAIAQLSQSALFIARSPLLAPIVLTAVAFNTGWFCIQGVFAAYALEHLGLTTTTLGFTLGVYGVGMVVGSRLYNRLSLRVSYGRLILVGPLCGALAAILLLMTLGIGGPILPGIAWALFGIGPIMWTISTTTLRQHITPPEMLGSINAFMVTSTAGFRPIGAILGGFLFGFGGYALVLSVACWFFLLQLTIIASSRAAGLKDLDHASEMEAELATMYQ